MLPHSLYNLFSSIKRINGVGEKRIDAYKRLNIFSLRDLFYHLPIDVIDRRNTPALASAQDGQIISQVVQVQQVIPPPRRHGKLPFKIICANDTGRINLIYFHIRQDYVDTNFPLGRKIAISGKVKVSYDAIDMIHPDILADATSINSVLRLEPVYPLTFALTSRYLGVTVSKAMVYAPDLPEWLDTNIINERNWPSWKESLQIVHYLKQVDDLTYKRAKERLAFDEIVAQQVCMHLARQHIRRTPKPPLDFTGSLAHKLATALPFTLTASQQKVIAEIEADQKSATRMFRLLQGDVGCGKTLVAFHSMLNVVEIGKQAALMVPTEILARQHFKKLSQLGEHLGVRIGLLISPLKPAEKEAVLAKLAAGEIDIVIGTHALFQEKVIFNDLALIIIDEQHRFGVGQRLSLVEKGNNADFLMMTATPIPRTLTMIGYGDIDISTITEKPACRLPIETSIVKVEKMESIIAGLRRIIAAGNKVFWVCPLIEDSEKLSFTNVKFREEFLSKHFPGQVGLVHGQMPASEREAVMEDFVNGNINILVATTVIEVGVDVPEAALIVIENAEHFGLAQLHQLRGRVGRGTQKSYCLLLAGKKVGDVGFSRLVAVKNSEDGFALADKDLELRGGGELLGTKQSGLPSFKAYDLLSHRHLLSDAATFAGQIVTSDPALSSPKGQQIRTLLYIFDMDKNLNYLNN